GKPNFEHLLRKFGEAVVPVARCDLREFNSHPKEQLLFKEFLEFWESLGTSGSSRGCLYLKDWHLSRSGILPEILESFPGGDFYSTPVYFSSDWLNEYWDAAGADDFRFVYMGPKG
ncbi:JMJD4 protein, partial [Pycnonotus jocosus]|nr:JMJD4 protein [Pycnonotus jocosus]